MYAGFGRESTSQHMERERRKKKHTTENDPQNKVLLIHVEGNTALLSRNYFFSKSVLKF